MCSATHLTLTQHKSNILQLKNKFTLGYMCLFQFWFPPCVCPEVGLLGHKVVPATMENSVEIP